MAAPPVCPMHTTSPCCLLAGPVGQCALELEKGAADLVAQAGVTFLVVNFVAPEVVATAAGGIFAGHFGVCVCVCVLGREAGCR